MPLLGIIGEGSMNLEKIYLKVMVISFFSAWVRLYIMHRVHFVGSYSGKGKIWNIFSHSLLQGMPYMKRTVFQLPTSEKTIVVRLLKY